MASSGIQNANTAATAPPLLPKPLSFAAVVSGRLEAPSSPRTNAKSFAECLSDGRANIKNPGSFRGEPAVFFTKEEISALASPLRFTLVGKFSCGRPPMATIRKFFSSLGLKSLKSVGLLHEHHVVIFINQEEDYSRLLLRSVWYVSVSPMKILKWTPDFFPHKESPVVPIWVGFPGLPLHFFEKSVLFTLGSVFGLPLKMDEPTALLSRPTVARLCIKLDVSKSRNHRLWIGSEKEGFWQDVVFENPPSYCLFCEKLGHDEKECFIKDPSLKKLSSKSNSTVLSKGKEKVHPSTVLGKSQKPSEGEWQIVKRKNKVSVGQVITPNVSEVNNLTSTFQPTVSTDHPPSSNPIHSTIFRTISNQQQKANQNALSSTSQASAFSFPQQPSETLNTPQTLLNQPIILPSPEKQTTHTFEHPHPVGFSSCQKQSASEHSFSPQQDPGKQASSPSLQVPAKPMPSVIDNVVPRSQKKRCVSGASEKNSDMLGTLQQADGPSNSGGLSISHMVGLDNGLNTQNIREEMGLSLKDGLKSSGPQAADLLSVDGAVGPLKGAGNSSTGPVSLEETFCPNAILCLITKGILAAHLRRKTWKEINHNLILFVWWK